MLAHNQDFGAVSQTDLIRSLDPSVAQASSKLVCLFVYILCRFSFVDLTLFDYTDQRPL